MWTGLVATSRITHATPAAMVAHVDSRNREEDIAVQLAESGVEVLLGGGGDRFYGARADGRNLDVSTLKELARRWAPDVAAGFSKSSAHLALEDIRDSIRELAHYRAHLLRPFAP